MEGVDQARILSLVKSKSIQEVTRIKAAREFANRLVRIDSGITSRQATDYYYERNIRAEIKERCSIAALQFLQEHRDIIASLLDDGGVRQLTDLISRHLGGPEPPSDPSRGSNPDRSNTAEHHQEDNERLIPKESASRRPYVETIFANWRQPNRGSAYMLPAGIYQILRRYKPEPPPSGSVPQDTQGASDFGEHAVICELIDVDLKNKECLVITSERYVYIGSLFLNFEGILFGILQRTLPGSTNINQRLISIKLELHKLPWYSGLCIKAGDTTHRPLAAECIFIPIPADHAKLYEEVEQVRRTIGDSYRVPEGSEISQYLTDTPSYQEIDNQQSRVRRIKDLSAIRALALENVQGITFFREPLRTLDGGTILSLSRRIKLQPLRQDARRLRSRSRRRPARSK